MNRVKELRELRGMSQKELALTLGIAQPSVSNWEKQRSDPTLDRVVQLEELFHVSRRVILCYEDIPASMMPMVSENAEPFSEIEFALSGEIHDLTDDEKKDILDYVRFKKAQRK